MKFTYQITEISRVFVEVEADNEDQAYNMVEMDYCSGSIDTSRGGCFESMIDFISKEAE